MHNRNARVCAARCPFDPAHHKIIPARTEMFCGFDRQLEQEKAGFRVSPSPASPECNRTILPCRISGNNTPASPIYPTTRLQPITDGQTNQGQELSGQTKWTLAAQQNDDSWSRPGVRERQDASLARPVLPWKRGSPGASRRGSRLPDRSPGRHRAPGTTMARSSGQRHSATTTRAPGASRSANQASHTMDGGSAFACGPAPRRA
jgi:hypothetical protein